MLVCGQANHAAIARVVFAIDQLELVAEIKIRAIVSIAAYLIRVCRGFPFAAESAPTKRYNSRQTCCRRYCIAPQGVAVQLLREG